MQAIMIGIDLAKSVFQLHGVDASGAVVLRKRLGRSQLLAFFAGHPRCIVAMEACGSAHYWGRLFLDLGHEVRLVPPQHAKPFRKRNKNDMRDAAAVTVAAAQPDMRFVPVKSAEQQAARALEGVRDLLVVQRTQCANALRGHLAEHGVAAAQGDGGLKRLLDRLDAGGGGELPAGLAETLAVLVRQWRTLTAEIDALGARLTAAAKADATARRLMTVPGVGPLTAHAVVAAIGDGSQFSRARDFAAWVGLTPLDKSSANKRRIGHITKAGDAGLRRLLTLGAAAHLRQMRARPQRMGPWLAGLLARRPVRVATVAQAAKTARVIWAILRSGQCYRPRQAPAAA
jgi:transposase